MAKSKKKTPDPKPVVWTMEMEAVAAASWDGGRSWRHVLRMGRGADIQDDQPWEFALPRDQLEHRRKIGILAAGGDVPGETPEEIMARALLDAGLVAQQKG